MYYKVDERGGVHFASSLTSHQNHLDPGQVVTLDSGFNSMFLFEKIYNQFKGFGVWKWGRKCQPALFKAHRFKTLKNKMKGGDYHQWYEERTGVHITLFKDVKHILFIDNCIDQNKLIRIVRHSNGERLEFTVPYVVSYYNNNMGEVEYGNLRRKANAISFKSKRKHNSTYISQCRIHVS